MLDRLPDDLYASISCLLSARDVLAARSTCRALYQSPLWLHGHPELMAYFAALACDLDGLAVAIALAIHPRSSLSTLTTSDVYLSLVRRLVRAGIHENRRVWATLRDSGFPADDLSTAAAVLALIAQCNAPVAMERVALSLLLPSDASVEWDISIFGIQDSDNKFLRLARIHRALTASEPLLALLGQERAITIQGAFVDQFAPDLQAEDTNGFEIVLGLQEGQPTDDLKRAANTVRRILSRTGHPNTDAVLTCQLVPRLVQLLSHSDQTIVHDASWSLCNLASFTEESTQLVVENGSVPAFLKHLDDGTSKLLRDLAVWTLTNIMADRIEYRDMAIDGGIVGKLAAQVTADLATGCDTSHDRQSVVNLAWAFRTLTYKWEAPAVADLERVVTACLLLLSCIAADEELIRDASGALERSMKQITLEHLHVLVAHGMFSRFVETLTVVAARSSSEAAQSFLETFKVLVLVMDRHKDGALLHQSLWNTKIQVLIPGWLNRPTIDPKLVGHMVTLLMHLATASDTTHAQYVVIAQSGVLSTVASVSWSPTHVNNGTNVAAIRILCAVALAGIHFQDRSIVNRVLQSGVASAFLRGLALESVSGQVREPILETLERLVVDEQSHVVPPELMLAVLFRAELDSDRDYYRDLVSKLKVLCVTLPDWLEQLATVTETETKLEQMSLQ
ncbi:armadillo-type protein [Blastocladiella britannica]|nr:armadillo-type protein [Blastocladiella britannica]